MRKKMLALLLVAATALSCIACGSKETTTSESKVETSETTAATETQKAEVVYEDVDVNDAVVHSDYTSVYDMIGANVTIDMVTEDPDTGLATITYEGKTYEAGLDFLSMAMVYNCTPAGDYTTEEEVYNQWWKLFIQRYNYMALEVPLYSNQYYDLYNAKLENFVTSPYWGVASAIVGASVKEGNDNSAILGSSTELSGAFRKSAWGKSNPGSADLDIEELTSGHSTVQTGIDGSYMWNMTALAEEPTSVKNDDGSLTYTIKVKDDLVFSDGSSCRRYRCCRFELFRLR